MKYAFIVSIFCMLFNTSVHSQKEKLSPEQTKELLNNMTLDSTKLLKAMATGACECIDSITINKKSSTDISNDISNCIDTRVSAYQLAMKLTQSLQGDANRKIELNISKNSPEYQRYYFEIERWLVDSCKSLQTIINANNEESEFSMSNNPEALKEYHAGNDAMQKGDFTTAISLFKKAVKIDEKFAFAWDNLGVCNRKAGNFDDALAAYQKSLELDPKGVTPLHNIPVVYEYQKKFDKAIEAYQNILKFYPDDPEAYYGTGRIYCFFVIDMEKALQNTCKAYTIYTNTSSPYRVDAEKNINYIYGKMKADGKEKLFFDILKESKIDPGN